MYVQLVGPRWTRQVYYACCNSSLEFATTTICQTPRPCFNFRLAHGTAISLAAALGLQKTEWLP
jgi:hypothetical protein